MKFINYSAFIAFLFLFAITSAQAADFSHEIILEPGWSVVSTPRLLSSHQFSTSSTSANYDIFVLNPNSVSNWSTMAELNQTEFQPLFGYFINNKTGTTTTLTFNYRQDVPVNERFFTRKMSAGWNSIGVADPSYALKQKAIGIDTDNVSKILDSIKNNTQSVYDVTANQATEQKVSVSDNWERAIFFEANKLADFRETKAYVVYNESSSTYIGYQNNDSLFSNDVNLAFIVTNTNYVAKVGDEKAELGRFTLDFNTSGGVASKDLNVTSVMLKNNGVEDLTKTSMNLYLEVAGTKVSDRAVIDGRYVTFYFSAAGYDLLKDNGAKTFIVKGDVIAKENTATTSYAFLLNKGTDIVATEKTTGSGVNVYTTTYGTTTADNVAVSSVTITAGAITASKKATSPSDTTIIKGADNTVLLANIKADEAINVDGLNIQYNSNQFATTTDQFENVRVYVNGALIGSFDPASSSAASLTKAIDSAMTLNKGDNLVEVKVRARTNATAGSAFKAVLDGNTMFSGMNPEYVSSRNAVSGSISGVATGGIFTVQGAGLTVTRNDGYSNGKVIVKGTSNVTLGKFTVKATNDDVTVSSISFGPNASTTPVDAANIYDAKLFVDGVQVGNTIDFGASGANFQSLNFVVAKDKSKTVEIKGSFDSSAAGGFVATTTINANDSRGTSMAAVSATSAQFVVVTTGTLAVAVGGDTPSAAILPAGNTVAKEIGQFKFTATNDAATLTEVNFVNSASTTVVSTSTDSDSAISSIGLYDGTTLLDSTTLVNGIGQFKNSNGLATVAANSNKTLSVKVLLNAIDNDASATNKDIAVAITNVSFKSSDGTATNNQSVAKIANAFRVRKTVPTVALQTLPDTSLSTAGDKVVSKFTVTADAAGDVTLKQVVLNYSTSTNAVIAGLANNALKVNGTTKSVGSSINTTAKTLKVTLTNYETIAAGTTKTFEILATVSASGSGTESITTKISEDTAYVTDGTNGNFIWSDGASFAAETWSNGYRVPGLTTLTQGLSK